jgi:hypothetical protein
MLFGYNELEIMCIYTQFNLASNWEDVRNRKLFFEKYAEENGFDPLVPQNWYKVKKDKFMAARVF